MRGFLVCFCSAALGGLVAAGTFGSGPMFRLEAREAADGNSGATAARLPAGQLTPDEAINVSVYERVNRAVVNITTQSFRGDGLPEKRSK